MNKTDDKRARDSAMEFFQLGFEPVLEIPPSTAMAWRSCSTRS